MSNLLNIAILTWWDSTIEKYASLNYKINKLYCDKHNYKLIHSDKDYFANSTIIRRPHWQRVPFLLEHISNYDYVIWIDADAFFYIDALPIDQLISYYSEFDCIFSMDVNHQYSYEINSGVFILKNTSNNRDLLSKWMSDELVKKGYGLYDQGVLRLLYDKNYNNLKSRSLLLPYGILQHFPCNEITKIDYPSASLIYKTINSQFEFELDFTNSNNTPNLPPLIKIDRPFIYHMAGCGVRLRVAKSTSYLESIKDLAISYS